MIYLKYSRDTLIIVIIVEKHFYDLNEFSSFITYQILYPYILYFCIIHIWIEEIMIMIYNNDIMTLNVIIAMYYTNIWEKYIWNRKKKTISISKCSILYGMNVYSKRDLHDSLLWWIMKEEGAATIITIVELSMV